MVSATKDTKLTAMIKLTCKIRIRVEAGVRAGIKLITGDSHFFAERVTVAKRFTS
jgi:hypothetical protein